MQNMLNFVHDHEATTHSDDELGKKKKKSHLHFGYGIR